MQWDMLANRVMEGDALTREEALAILDSRDDELLALLHAALRLRTRAHGRDVHVHVLQNAKSDRCPEDCAFCSQSSHFETDISDYGLKTEDELVEGAHQAKAMGAARYCMVTATRGPSGRDLDVVCAAVRRIKEELPDLQICTSLGLLDAQKAARLSEAGVDRYNHNLETSERHFPNVVSTHGYSDRVETVRAARSAGMEACCGGIMGMGESPEDVVSLAFTLRDLDVASIPVNFLDPRPGTPLGDSPRLSPEDCLRALSLFRFVHPNRDIRISGGREANLRHLQPLSLYPANSLFSQGYLTTPGQGAEADRRMIEDAGFRVVEVI